MSQNNYIYAALRLNLSAWHVETESFHEYGVWTSSRNLKWRTKFYIRRYWLDLV